ncbi:DUF350 domain-containing protein [Candidatus Micrarchaeota archaeon]|nr:DUF350 domain-containing protein [Candidatus Micrarchaeota archaeon]
MAGLDVLFLQFLRLLLAIVFAVGAQYLAIKIFDKMTSKIDEMEELKKGNLAVGIVLASVILSVATIISGGVARAVPSSLNFGSVDFWTGLGYGLFSLFVALVFAVVSQFVALRVFDSMTEGIDEQKELKKGNLAMAVLLAAVIYATAIVVVAGLPSF